MTLASVMFRLNNEQEQQLSEMFGMSFPALRTFEAKTVLNDFCGHRK